MISLQNFGVPRWIHESDNKKMYVLLLLVPKPCRNTTWNVKQRQQCMIKWDNWKLIFTCSEVLRLSPSKITNNSTGIYYKHYVRRVVFLPIIFFIFVSHTLRASFTIMTPENTWHLPWNYNVMNKCHKIMDGSILHKCFTAHLKNDYHSQTKNSWLYFNPLLKGCFHPSKYSLDGTLLHIIPSQYFQIFQELEGKSTGNKDINSFCKESYTKHLYTHGGKYKSTSELRGLPVY